MDFDTPLFDRLLLWLDSAHAGPWNMAVDQAWLEQTPVPMLRVYGWDQPTVSIGYAQSLPKLQDALPGWPVVRRWTGGGVVLHQEDHTYSVIVPAGQRWSETRPVESYQQIHGSLAAALAANGYPACRLAEKEDVIEAPFCFVAPALHDVVCGSAKVAGAGQRRGRLGLLHQGSVQQVQLTPEFWRTWAQRVAHEVEVVEDLPDPVRDRANHLAAHRYALPQWLAERDDLL